MSAPSSIRSALQRRPANPLADELSAIFDTIDDEPLLAALAAYRWTGRPGWSLRALWRAHVASYVLGLGTTNDLVRRLQDDVSLRDLCGFEELPSRWTFNRFVSRLSQHTALVEAALATLTTHLHELLPDFGKGIAVDASTVRSWSSPSKPVVSDPEASFTMKNNRWGKKTWYWGYKLHLAVDARYELPIAATFTTAKNADVTQFEPVLEHARELLPWLQPAYVTADRGYDSKAANEYVVKEMHAVSIILMRQMRKAGSESKDIADEDGTPRCLGGQEMVFSGYTPDAKLRYRCPEGGCPLQNRQGVLYCDVEAVIDPLEDLRRFSVIPRRSREWDALYSTRQSVERVFSRLKQHRAMDSHCKRGLRKVKLHTIMGLLTMQAVAVVRAASGEFERVREVSRRIA